MRFICGNCQSQMELQKDKTNEKKGSVSMIFSCPSCNQSMKMQTNSNETQIVRSLGLPLGDESSSTASKCPFTSVAESMMGEKESELIWTEEAKTRLEKVPEFMRPMIRASVEQFAKDSNSTTVEASTLDNMKESIGIG